MIRRMKKRVMLVGLIGSVIVSVSVVSFLIWVIAQMFLV